VPRLLGDVTYHLKGDVLVWSLLRFHMAAPQKCPNCHERSIERWAMARAGGVAAAIAAAESARGAPRSRHGARTRPAENSRRVAKARARRGGRTQMITKGHDFPGVTLVGVVLADHGMGLPIFAPRSAAFSCWNRCRRAGRGERPGRVISRRTSATSAVLCARDHDYARFVEAELEMRREPAFPPMVRLGCVAHRRRRSAGGAAVAEEAAAAARRVAQKAPAEERAEVLGPAEAPLSRLKGPHRWQLFSGRNGRPRCASFCARRPTSGRQRASASPWTSIPSRCCNAIIRGRGQPSS